MSSRRPGGKSTAEDRSFAPPCRATKPFACPPPPIHHLPVELLLEVFSVLTGPIIRRPMTWKHLMLVCRRWRAIILDAPQFWAVIDFKDHMKWVELCLSRSHRALINVVSIGLSSQSTDTAMSLIAPHTARIRSFTFQSYDAEGSTSALQAFFQKQFAAMEELSLCLVPRKDDIPAVDPDLTASRYPRLKSLSLKGAAMPRDPQVYIRLESLELHQGCSPTPGFSSRELSDILRATSRLEELDLSGLQVSPAPPAPSLETEHGHYHDSPPISLRYLRSFYLEHDRATASRVLKLLDIPARSHLHLRVGIPSSGWQDGWSDSFKVVLSELLSPSIRRNLETSTELAISMSSRTCNIRDPTPRQPGNVTTGELEAHEDRVYISVIEPDSPTLDPHLEDIISVVPLAQLTTLTVSSQLPESFDTTTWATFLGACPQLITLAISEVAEHRPCPTHVFEALTPADGLGVPPPLLCPNLRRLSTTSYYVHTGPRVLAFARSRAEHGCKLSYISLQLYGYDSHYPFDIIQGTLTDAESQELRSLVDEVVILEYP